MMLKKFVADSRFEALLKAEKELGKDIRVVGEKKINNSSYLGLYVKEMVELTVVAVPSVLDKSGKGATPVRPTLAEEVTDRITLSYQGNKLPSPPPEPKRPLKPAQGSSIYPKGGENFSLTSSVFSPAQSNKFPQKIPDNVVNATHIVSLQPPSLEEHVQEERIQTILDLLQKRKSENDQTPLKSSNSNMGKSFSNVQNTYSTEKSPVLSPIQMIEAKLAEIHFMISQMQSDSEKILLKPIPSYPTGLQKLREKLAMAEMPCNVIDELTDSLRAEIPFQALLSEAGAIKECVHWLKQKLCFGQPCDFDQSKGPGILALLGPPGVGKTTTIAKLAASYVLMERKTVVLFTFDTYRIGASHQLSQYAQIIEVEIEIIYEPHEIPAILQKHSKKDLILIDTAGRCQSNLAELEELRQFLNYCPNVQKYLTLSAVTKFSDMLEQEQRFRETVGYHHLIFSQVDATNRFGSLLALLLKTSSSLAYITNGQRVPDDFAPATSEFFLSLLFPEL